MIWQSSATLEPQGMSLLSLERGTGPIAEGIVVSHRLVGATGLAPACP